jgi:hypothetical protein
LDLNEEFNSKDFIPKYIIPHNAIKTKVSFNNPEVHNKMDGKKNRQMKKNRCLFSKKSPRDLNSAIHPIKDIKDTIID